MDVEDTASPRLQPRLTGGPPNASPRLQPRLTGGPKTSVHVNIDFFNYRTLLDGGQLVSLVTVQGGLTLTNVDSRSTFCLVQSSLLVSIEVMDTDTE